MTNQWHDYATRLEREFGKWLTAAEIEAERIEPQGHWGAKLAAAIRRDIDRVNDLVASRPAAAPRAVEE